MRIWSIGLIVVLAAGAVAFSWFAITPPTPPEPTAEVCPTHPEAFELTEAKIRRELEDLDRKLRSWDDRHVPVRDREATQAKLDQLRREKAEIERRIQEHRKQRSRACRINPLGKDC